MGQASIELSAADVGCGAGLSAACVSSEHIHVGHTAGPSVQRWPVAGSILNAHCSAATAAPAHLHIPAVDFDTAGCVLQSPRGGPDECSIVNPAAIPSTESARIPNPLTPPC
ncbi:unnamed protein product [Gadus morhua 'NCC']